MLKVVHVITGLGVGGAEHALLRLLRHTDPSDVDATVVSLQAGGALASDIRRLNVPVHELGLARPSQIIGAVRDLRNLVRGADVVQTWMYHADVIGGLVARSLGLPVAWSLRQTDASRATTKRATRILVWVAARLSWRLPHAIICCAESVVSAHVCLGFDRSRMTVVPNGFVVRDRTIASSEARARLGIPSDGPLITRVGRWHPHKDIPTMLDAFSLLAAARPDVRLLLVGPGLDLGNADLASCRRRMDAGSERVHPVGHVTDVGLAWAATDIACSSSLAEGFPNAVGEAMAAGLPVVATDVGDTALLIGESGVLVPPRNPRALADALNRCVSVPPNERHELGEGARHRIQNEFSMGVMIDGFAKVHRGLAARSETR